MGVKIDGRAIAADIISELRSDNAARSTLSLGIVVVGNTTVSDSFVAAKKRAAERVGVRLIRVDLDEHTTTDGVVDALETLTKETDGIIIQLPLLGASIDEAEVLRHIPITHDVDNLTRRAAVPAPVAGAVRELLTRSGVAIAGASVAVVGAGRLVGTPTAALLESLGAHVTMVAEGDDVRAVTSLASVIVLGTGVPGLLDASMISPGCVIIDAGTSEQSGKLLGDMDASCIEKAARYTPVPGGVGPVAVAMIFKNLYTLSKYASP